MRDSKFAFVYIVNGIGDLDLYEAEKVGNKWLHDSGVILLVSSTLVRFETCIITRLNIIW